MVTRAQFSIDGAAITDIATFYGEINRVFMTGESWQLGESLDALNDLLYGGIGAIGDAEAIEVVWLHHELSRAALGYETTRAYYEAKLSRPDVFRTETFAARLRALEDTGEGTYFDLVLEVFADHPRIVLTLA